MELPTLDKFPRHVLAHLDIQRGFIASRLIIAAEKLQVFRLLHGKRMKSASIGRALQIRPSRLPSFLNALVGLGLLNKSHDAYGNTRLAEKYFVDERSIYWTRQYSQECLEAYEALSALEECLQTGKCGADIRGRKKPSYVEAMTRDRRRAEDFTQMLFHFHREDAAALARHLDLSGHRKLLDVGGGSGVMSIALVRANPQLSACVLEIEPVCKVTSRIVRRAGLCRRIKPQAGDIHQPLPAGYDVVMFCDVGPISKPMLQNAWDSLTPGGLVVAVDRFFSDDGAKPLDRLLGSLVGSSVQMTTRGDVASAMRSCGFRSVKAKRVWRDLWCITGAKPSRH